MLYEENELTHALGLSSASPKVMGVSIDSRTTEKGDVFFALKGERFDANRFVEQAFERGASCAVVSDGANALSNEGARIFSERLLWVKDTESALVRCGCYARGRTSARIVAITGSLGKTSVRALLEAILPDKVSASRGNLNNHIGVPLSLARMPRDCDYGVFELGMNHAGEIAKIATWVRPHVGVITSIAAVHLEFFKDEIAICDAKAELLDHVSHAVLLPATEPYASRLCAKARSAGVARIALFGYGQEDKENKGDEENKGEEENYVLRKYSDAREADDDSVSMLATFPARAEAMAPREKAAKEGRREHRWQVGGRGKARALASLCALATCDLLGLDLEGLVAKLSVLPPPRGRGTTTHLSLSQPLRRIRLIDESYNASPPAVRNALAVLSRFPPRRLAALGDMLELGEEAARLHEGLALEVARCCDLVFTSGTLSEGLYKALPRDKRGAHRADAHALADTLFKQLKDGDTLLVKGSHGSEMASAVSYLEQRAVGHGY